jgi:peptide/nickel transport system substrate-binding protein/oligopeptide transport system substrate-binding protein
MGRVRPGRHWTSTGGDRAPRLVIGALIWLAASGAAAAPVDGGAYRRPLGNDPATLDPARIADVYSRSVAQQIFDGLVQFDQTLTVTPALAQFWKASRDGLTWTFTLRKGVRFHHGREVAADDVVFSLTRILDPRTRSGGADHLLAIRGAQEYRDGRAAQIAGLVALDPHTVQVTLTEATVPFVSVLAVGHAKIVPRDLVEQQGEAFGSQPVGTGPFRFVRWDRGREIVLAANPEYFDGPPRLSRVVFRIFPGEQQERVFQEFQAGALEDAPVPSRDYRQIVASPKHVYVKRPMFNHRHYGFNTRVKPLDDRRVRQALIYAIDREALISEIFLGRQVLARGILPPGTFGYNPKLAGYPHDPARARELLIRAGYPGGRGLPVLPIWSSVKFPDALREHERMRKDLEAIGVRAEFQYLTDWPVFAKQMGEGKLPVFLHAWYADVPDPDNFLFKLFHSQSSRNFFGYANPVVDGLLTRARAEQDPLQRVELYRRAEEQILEDAPVLPIWHLTYERLFQSYVRSVEVNGLGDPYIPLRKIWLEKLR